MRLIVHALAIVAVLTIVAAVAPVPPESDRAFYQQNHGRVVIPDCSGADCFRPLVATVLERLPGPSILKWKIYAVLANAIGALAVARFCVLVGLSATPSLAAAWLSALGAGALYAVYDCYTSDSLMYMVGPLMAVWLWQGRYVRAGALGGLGVFAKEFAAAPIWIFAIFAALERRWNAAVRLSLVSAAVTLVWLTMHASFIVLHNYSYGATTSADLLHGGYLATWLGSMRPTGAFTYLFTTFGALYLLWPVGLVRGSPALRRLAIAAVPAIAAFVYVQQPERALWNFHFIVIALAAVVLQDVPGWIVALLVGSYGVANMRIGAQLPFRGAGRAALAISVIIAAALAIRALRRRTMVRASTRPVEMNTPLSPIPSWTVAAAEASVFLVLVAALLAASAGTTTRSLKPPMLTYWSTGSPPRRNGIVPSGIPPPLPESEVHRFLEGEASLLERWRMDRRRMRCCTAQEIFELAAKGNVLIRGWGAGVLFRDVPQVISVRVCAPMSVRESLMAERLGTNDRELVREEIERYDKARAETMRVLFNMERTALAEYKSPSIFQVTRTEDDVAQPRGQHR
jgi:hypothetical protein